MEISGWGDGLPPLAITAVFAGSVVYPPGGQHGPRVQRDLQLVLVHTGEMLVTIDDRRHLVSAGHVALLHPGRREEFHFSGTEETWHRWVAISTAERPENLAPLAQRLPVSIPLRDDLNLLVDRMTRLQDGAGAPDQYRDVLMALAFSCLTLYAADSVATRDSKAHPAIILAKSLIHHKYADVLKLAELAECCHVTPEHLIRLFRRYEGQTPMEYLWRFRVKQALELLRRTGLGVGEIADRTGFRTSHHFSRVLRRETGMTPTEMRRRSFE